jgi:hypothetical protein
LSFFQPQSYNNINGSSNDAFVPFDEHPYDEDTTERALVVTGTPRDQSLGQTGSSNTNATQEMVVPGRDFSTEAIVEALNKLMISDPNGATSSALTTQSGHALMARLER